MSFGGNFSHFKQHLNKLIVHFLNNSEYMHVYIHIHITQLQ